MYQNKRIEFVFPDDKDNKENLIKLFLKSGPIPKNSYQKILSKGILKDKLFKDLSTTAHTWVTLILYPFTNVIPERIQES